MLTFIPEIIKSPIRKVVQYKRLKDLFNFIKLKRKYHNFPQEFIVLDLPELVDYNTKSSKDLYTYYWFAENIQYYGFPIKQLESDKQRKRIKVLYNSNFGIIPLIYNMELYFKDVIKSSERALIRKAIKNGYICKEISYDDYQDEILEINTSKGERQGRSMGEDYIKIVKRDEIVKRFNPNIYTYGCFDSNDKLIAYYMFEKFTNFIHVNKGIGHLDHLNMGVMNYLFAYSLCELSQKHQGLSLVYGTYSPDCSNGLIKFKKHVGCKRKTLLYRGSNEQFNVLYRFLATYSLHGDSGLNYVRDYVLSTNI